MNSIGKRISYTRKQRGLTQEKLAELANISIQFLSDIENNKKSMTITTLKNLADCLNVTTDYIIYGKTNSENNSTIHATLDTLSAIERKQAEKLLNIFIETIREKNLYQ